MHHPSGSTTWHPKLHPAGPPRTAERRNVGYSGTFTSSTPEKAPTDTADVKPSWADLAEEDDGDVFLLTDPGRPLHQDRSPEATGEPLSLQATPEWTDVGIEHSSWADLVEVEEVGAASSSPRTEGNAEDAGPELYSLPEETPERTTPAKSEPTVHGNSAASQRRARRSEDTGWRGESSSTQGGVGRRPRARKSADWGAWGKWNEWSDWSQWREWSETRKEEISDQLPHAPEWGEASVGSRCGSWQASEQAEGETGNTTGWSASQTEKVQGETSSTQGDSAKVTGARLAPARHASERQRETAGRSCLRLGDEEPSVVGASESLGADSECPLQSLPVGRWRDTQNSTYEVFFDDERSCSVRTIRPTGSVRVTRALIRLESVKGGAQVVWAHKFILMPGPGSDSIRWASSRGGKDFVWRRVACQRSSSDELNVGTDDYDKKNTVSDTRHLQTDVSVRRGNWSSKKKDAG